MISDYETRLRRLEHLFAGIHLDAVYTVPQALGLNAQTLTALAGSGSTFTGGEDGEGVFTDPKCGISLPATLLASTGYAGRTVDLQWDSGSGTWYGAGDSLTSFLGGLFGPILADCGLPRTTANDTAFMLQLTPPSAGGYLYVMRIFVPQCEGGDNPGAILQASLPDTIAPPFSFSPPVGTYVEEARGEPTCSNSPFVSFGMANFPFWAGGFGISVSY